MKQLLLICAVVALVGCGGKDEWPEFKTCERCKEADIKYWADVCKHCGKDPDGPNGVEKRAELMEIWLEEQRTENESAVVIPPERSVGERFLAGELTKADLEKVTKLKLHYNQLTEVPKGLEKCTQLEVLQLNDNKLTDVKGLEKLTQLTHLYLDFNQLTDVKGLEKLTQLTRLDLYSNPVLTKAQIAELQKALPNCEITSNPTK